MISGIVLAGAGLGAYIATAGPPHRPEFLDAAPAVQPAAERQAGGANLSQQVNKVPTPVGFAGLVKNVRPAVVTVRVRIGEGAASQTPFGWAPGAPGGAVLGLGSGFFVSSDGYIVTNNHVIENAQVVNVTTEAGKTLTAHLVGTDAETDLALIKVDGGPFPFLTLNATPPAVGDWVLAIGNPFGLGGTVTAGIVSALGRDISDNTYDRYIQIDAPVNRGNSGGPSIGMNGQVMGVNSAIYSPSGGSVGIAFVIPATTVRRVIVDLQQHGNVPRGWLGVEAQTLTPDLARALGLGSAKGVVIAGVATGGPGAKAGLKPGDVVTAVNGQTVNTARDLVRTVAGNKPGTQITLNVHANGANREEKVMLGPRANQASSGTSTVGRGR